MLSEPGHLAARETEVIRILRILSEATDGFVLIGGYAANAHGQHRFSLGCDLATNRNNVPTIDTTLLAEGYELWKDRARPPIGVTTREYRKTTGEPVSVELFVNNVVSTTTRGSWSYKFIRENSVESIVMGATDSTPARVVQRNLLVAMKLHSGMPQDFADVVMLSEKVDWKSVARWAACGSKERLIEQIDFGIKEISSARFASDLRSDFAMRSDPSILMKRASLGLHTVRTLVAQEKFKESL